MPRKTGRQFFAAPGPTNIPDSVLRAMDRGTIDFNDTEFLDVYDRSIAGLKRLVGASGHIFFYTASGHGAWEATLVNLRSPGDHVLVLESGIFSVWWAEMATRLGLHTKHVRADRSIGVDPADVTAMLREDGAHTIKAVLAVHNETSTGMALPMAEIRAAIDVAGHPALLLVDTISSLGSLEYKMDAWGIDATVGGSQKGLMLPTGLSFTAVSDKAMVAHEAARLQRSYLDWGQMKPRRHGSFVGTVPTQPFYGLDESLRLIELEGLDTLVARHHRLAEATRHAVRAWSANDGPRLFCQNPARVSDSVTAIRMPEGHDANELRKVALERFNVALGGGLGDLNGQVFRIGHMGDLNEPMMLGALATVEMCLDICGVPHGKGGVAAAMSFLAEGAASPS
jgi:alanine-glyoxylate transaminase/serine-glyoxylate transaminase/serine-pyruvate transaminase